MMLLRRRHLELDKFRSLDGGFNHARFMFFRTRPPGINSAGVFFTEAESFALANGVPPPVGAFANVCVEPAN